MMRRPLVAMSLLFSLSACVVGPGVVRLRPDGSPGPEPCPRDALKAMALLRIYPGQAAWIEFDLNKAGQHNITINDGPIESALVEPLGDDRLATGTLLYGRVWTSGPDVVVRYYQAQPVDAGVPIPICAVARLGDGQLKKQPGSAPGIAVLQYSGASVQIVDAFR